MKPNVPQLFYHASDIAKPEDVIPHLGKGERHWRKGRSAYELAHSWVCSVGIPVPVRDVLALTEDFRGARLLEGMFEKETDLTTKGRPSQTDLLVLCRCAAGIGVIGIEGKVDEPFGPLVGDWRDGSPGKKRRLKSLCSMLVLCPDAVDELRYQLFHRTAAVLLEAQRYEADAAMMLVHSFSEQAAGFADFQAFADRLGAPVDGPGQVSQAIERRGVRLTLGWVADAPKV